MPAVPGAGHAPHGRAARRPAPGRPRWCPRRARRCRCCRQRSPACAVGSWRRSGRPPPAGDSALCTSADAITRFMLTAAPSVRPAFGSKRRSFVPSRLFTSTRNWGSRSHPACERRRPFLPGTDVLPPSGGERNSLASASVRGRKYSNSGSVGCVFMVLPLPSRGEQRPLGSPQGIRRSARNGREERENRPGVRTKRPRPERRHHSSSRASPRASGLAAPHRELNHFVDISTRTPMVMTKGTVLQMYLDSTSGRTS